MKAPDLPSPREKFTPDHLARWPMGAVRIELKDGDIVWLGDFDGRDAVVACSTFSGFRVRIDAGVGLTVGPTAGKVRALWRDDRARVPEQS